MAKFKVELKGYRELQKQLKQLPKSVSKEIDGEIGAATMEIRQRAIEDAPADQGLLKSEIVNVKESDLNWSVYSQADYSEYVEFGTRSKVRIPEGAEQLGISSKKSSLSAKEAIFAWCKRKGIEENLWYPIYRKLMTVGMEPHPFFYKQLPIVEPKLIKQIRSVLDDQRIE